MVSFFQGKEDSIMDQIKRIEEMEANLDRTREAVDRLAEALDEYEDVQSDLRELLDYYDSDLWMNDFEDDEEGKLPEDLKRGVLSEDAVYDLIADNRDLISRMLRVIADQTEDGSV